MTNAAEIKSQIDIVAYISRDVRLVKRGNNHVGLCPFHDEKTPSFSVSEKHQSFRCFGCGKSGDVITYYQERTNSHGDFAEAVQQLCKDVGIAVESVNDELYDYLNDLAAQFRRNIPVEASDYIQRRKLPAIQGIGYCTDLQYSEVGDKAGLFSKDKKYPYLKGRIVFPICDAIGRVIAFTARKMDWKKGDSTPKYINTSESPIFHKEKTLYNLHLAKTEIKKLDKAYVVEGTTDVSALQNNQHLNVVGTCGTAFTPFHLRILQSLTQNIAFLFDGDEAGRKACKKSLKIAFDAGNYNAIGLLLPPGQDPDDYLNAGGRLEDLQAVSYLEITDDGSVVDKREMLNRISEVDDMLQREVLINDFCTKFNVSKSDTYDEIKFIRKKRSKSL